MVYGEKWLLLGIVVFGVNFNPKLYGVLTILSSKGLSKRNCIPYLSN